MANIDIPVDDLAFDDVLDFFCAHLQAPYPPFLDPPDNLIPNPVTKEEHVEARLAVHFSGMYNLYKKSNLLAVYEDTIPEDFSIG